MLSMKLALRLARRWQAAWEAVSRARTDHDNAWRRVQDRYALAAMVRRRLEFVAERQFPFARRNLTTELQHQLRELGRLAGLLREELFPRLHPPLDPHHWLAEVRQLVDEFGDVEVRWNERAVRAVTEPIILRGIELGRFGIDFHWNRFASETGVRCFDVVALEPNPASGRDEIVHPHVNGNDLCAGDAEGPVRHALEGGRVVEAFLLIRSVLTTYNRGSPYVALDAWEGSPCSDCGTRIRDGDGTACEGCDRNLCDACYQSCERCHSPRCGNCLETCSVCECRCCSTCLVTVSEDQRVCPSCLVACAECGHKFPKDELVDGLCCDCEPDEEETDDDDPDDEDHEERIPVCVPSSRFPEEADVLAAGVAENAVPLPRGAD